MPGSIMRWDPLADLSDLRSGIDRVLNDWFDGRERAHLPEIDVLREDDSLVVRADLPGIRPDEVKVEVEDGVLTVSGAHDESSEETEKDYVRRERRHGSFHRSLALPEGVKPSEVTATTKDGVVEVRVPLPQHTKKETVTITPTAG